MLINTVIEQIKILILNRGYDVNKFKFLIKTNCKVNIIKIKKIIGCINISNFTSKDILCQSQKWIDYKTKTLNKILKDCPKKNNITQNKQETCMNPIHDHYNLDYCNYDNDEYCDINNNYCTNYTNVHHDGCTCDTCQNINYKCTTSCTTSCTTTYPCITYYEEDDDCTQCTCDSYRKPKKSKKINSNQIRRKKKSKKKYYSDDDYDSSSDSYESECDCDECRKGYRSNKNYYSESSDDDFNGFDPTGFFSYH